MSKIETVLGPIAVTDIGFCLMHEHIVVSNWSMRQNFEDWFNPDTEIPKAIDELSKAKAKGVDTIVDLTPINLGRDIDIIRRVAEKTGVNVIAATGFYWNEEPWMSGWSATQLAEFMIRDIEVGIHGTSSKAGIIKCATDHPGVTEINRKLLEAAAITHKHTGVPISTHTCVHNQSGLAQQDVFEEMGVDLSRVVIGHCGDTDDIDYLQAILNRGSYIGMDRFGLDSILPTDKRVQVIAALCQQGHAGKMVVSHDACSHIDFFSDQQMIEQFAPNWNFCHIPEDVLPALKKEGVSDTQVNQMMVGNPADIFSNHQSYG
ncbi:MAG: phosphotriesterase [Pseudomonadales bacterium]|nr:phosphotriesterase [Pseudomonadales bacterium]